MIEMPPQREGLAGDRGGIWFCHHARIGEHFASVIGAMRASVVRRAAVSTDVAWAAHRAARPRPHQPPMMNFFAGRVIIAHSRASRGVRRRAAPSDSALPATAPPSPALMPRGGGREHPGREGADLEAELGRPLRVGVARGRPATARRSTACRRRPTARRISSSSARAVEEQDVGAFLHIHLDARERLVDARRRAAIGAGEDEDAAVLRRFHRGADLHAGLLARQAGLAGGGEGAGGDLVLDQDRRRRRPAIGAHGALHVHGVAVAVVAIGQHQQVRRGAVHHRKLSNISPKEIRSRSGPPRRLGGDAGAGEEGGLRSRPRP